MLNAQNYSSSKPLLLSLALKTGDYFQLLTYQLDRKGFCIQKMYGNIRITSDESWINNNLSLFLMFHVIKFYPGLCFINLISQTSLWIFAQQQSSNCENRTVWAAKADDGWKEWHGFHTGKLVFSSGAAVRRQLHKFKALMNGLHLRRSRCTARKICLFSSLNLVSEEKAASCSVWLSLCTTIQDSVLW